MAQLNVEIDNAIMQDFLDLIYIDQATKDGDLKRALEEAMLDYIVKYAK